MSLRVHLLGRFEAGGQELPSGIRGHLLAFLAHSGDWVSRERVAFMFWPDMSDDAARRNLRQVLNRIKSVDMPFELEADTQRLRWQVPTDLAELRQAVGRQDWQAVLDLYRGDLLADWSVDIASGFGAWLEVERGNLKSIRRRAAIQRNRELAAENRHAEAALILTPFLSSTEPDEDLVCAYMRCAYLAGERNLALGAYQQLEKALETEFDAEPLDSTQQLHDTILAAEPLAASVAAPAAPEVPLGVQRPPRMIAREEAVQAVLAADTPLVLVRGEAGVGKTRLLEELAPDASRVRCLENMRTVPFRPLAQLLEQLVQTHGVPDEQDARLLELGRLVPRFAGGTGIPDADPATARSRLLEAVAWYLELVLGNSNGPFQLAFDDLQWADSGTLELLTVLAERGQLRMIGTFRRYEQSPELEELLSATGQAGLSTLVEIWPLGEADLAELLAHLMERADSAPLFARWLFQTSGGNVMFALETLRALFEAGSLRRGSNGWESDLDAITVNYSELEQPRAITDVINRRLSHLDEAAHRTAQAAAVVGEGFDTAILAAITELGELELLDILDELERVGLLAGDRFRHDLIRQSIYGALTSARRAVMHQRAAHVLDNRDNPILVAQHFMQAGDTASATIRWMKAAAQLRNAGRYEDARELVERVLPAVEASGDQVSTWKLKAELCLTVRGLGLHDECSVLAQEILARCSDPGPRAVAYDNLASVLQHQGRLAESEEVARKGLEVARKAGDERLTISIRTILVANLVYRDRSEEALVMAQELVEEIRRSGTELDLAVQLSNLGAILDTLERDEEAIKLHEEAVEIAQRLDAKRQLVDITLNLLSCHADRGSLDDGILAQSEEVLAWGQFEGTDTLRNNLAYALLTLGRKEDAVRHWQQQTLVGTDPTLVLLAWSRLAQYHHDRAAVDEAEEALVHVRELAGDTEFAVALASAAYALLTCSSSEEDHSLAREVARRSGYTPDTLHESLEVLKPLLAGNG